MDIVGNDVGNYFTEYPLTPMFSDKNTYYLKSKKIKLFSLKNDRSYPRQGCNSVKMFLLGIVAALSAEIEGETTYTSSRRV